MTAPDALAYDVRSVSVQHGDVRALDRVTLTVGSGASVALVGPSGAGKTSMLRVLAGVLSPTRGCVQLFGADLHDLRRTGALPAMVGLMPQRLDLVPQLTVKHNVQAGALGRWGLFRSLVALLLPVENPLARAATARVGIENRFLQRVSDCSGGEQQRAALGRLLVQDPRVLLVDEPVSSLDPARADQLLGLLRRLSDEDGRTLIASLHSPELARRHFDRLIGLRDGRVVFDARSSEVTDALLEQVYELTAPREPVQVAPERRGGSAPAG